MSYKTVCVAGGGVLGSQIAFQAAYCGFDVTIWLRSEGSIGRTQPKIDHVREEYIAAIEGMADGTGEWCAGIADSGQPFDKEAALAAVERAYSTLKLELDLAKAVADADLVIECVAENMATKKELLGRLDALCKEDAIFASNTSSLSITEMGQGLKHQLIGMHFFNPVPAMKLVEVIAGGNTPAELVEKIKTLSTEIGKTPVVVNEAPGFVVNKILIPYCNEGVCVLQEGVASAEDIDIAMQLGCNHPMGPLHLGDLIGWDIVLNIMDVLYNETHDSKYRANVLIRKMVRAGKLGIKSGEGFFNYKK